MHLSNETINLRSQRTRMNDNITIVKCHFLWKKWYANDIVLIKDLLDDEDIFLSSEELSSRNHIFCSF